jgi:hypothetical protein
MRRELIELLVVTVIICGACSGCSKSHSNSAQRENDGVDPDDWAPTKEAIAAARREKDSPLSLAPTAQPRASDYDLNPRAAMQAQENEETEPGYESRNTEPVEDDPALGEIERLPPPPALPKLGQGDEADQFGLPEWERMARGELHVKRIRY